MPLKIRELHAIGSEYGNVAICQKEEITGVIHNGGNVAGHKVLILAQPDHSGRALTNRTNLFQTPLEIIARAKAPFSRRTARRTASSRSGDFIAAFPGWVDAPFRYFSTRWAMTSVSVSVMSL